MNKKILFIISTVALILSACNLGQPSTPTVDPSVIYTQAALTVQAQFTGQPATPVNGTQIPAVTETPLAGTATSEVSTNTPTASPTSQPTATSTTTSSV